MIGKSIKGKSFAGCVRYCVNKPDATILEAEGVRIQNAATIASDFNLQRLLNPELGKAVGHTVLSWTEADKPKLNDRLMVEIAKKYMQQMSITDTQYLIVKHTDRDHPHVHIIFNRVNNKGKTITDQNDYARNSKVCRSLTEAYGLHIAAGKNRVKRERLKTGDRQRYQIYDALRATLHHARSWEHIQAALQQKGIQTIFKYKSGTNQVQGVSFKKDGLTFKGSAIDRAMSFAGIEKILALRQQLVSLQQQKNKMIASQTQQQQLPTATGSIKRIRPQREVQEAAHNYFAPKLNLIIAQLDALLKPMPEADFAYQPDKKKKKPRRPR